MSASSYFLITVILKMFVTTNEFDDDLISNVLKGVKLKNTIIHESNLEVSEKDARNILLSVKKNGRSIDGRYRPVL